MKNRVLLLAATLIFSLGISNFAVAQDKFFPKGCKDNSVEYHGDLVYLATNQTERTYRVYVFKNISYSPILLDHVTSNNGPTNGLDSIIDTDKWSAILVNSENFAVSCKESVGGYDEAVSCENAVKVCELAVSPVMMSSQGVYWITENNGSKRSLFGSIREQGIYP